jgi:hypothetical protein
VRVVVAGELPRQEHNAALHLFSASPDLVGFGRSAYRQRSPRVSRVLGQLLERFQAEGFAMSYTMEDFERDYFKKHFVKLTPEQRREIVQALSPQERREVLQALPAEERLAGLPAEQIQQYLDQLTAGRPAEPPKPRRKK